MLTYVPVEHPRFVRAQRDIFTQRVTLDCMNHTCRLVDDNHRVKLEACCQYGAQADLGERERIIEHAEQIRALLDPDVRDIDWFCDEGIDPDFPSGGYVRTRSIDERCVFLHQDQRGCAIHRASIEGGWDFHGVKPGVCRLFPLSFETDAIVISDDYQDYSCAYVPDAPTLYRGGRDTLAALFGVELVVALDAAEARLGVANQTLIPGEKLARRAP